MTVYYCMVWTFNRENRPAPQGWNGAAYSIKLPKTQAVPPKDVGAYCRRTLLDTFGKVKDLLQVLCLDGAATVGLRSGHSAIKHTIDPVTDCSDRFGRGHHLFALDVGPNFAGHN